MTVTFRPGHPGRTVRLGWLLGAAFSGLMTAVAPALAADDSPMHIIVGYAPGGAADSLARIYAEQLRQDGQGTVIVENRPGASARLALDYVKRSKPDGKTIFIGPSPLFTIFPLTYKSLSYDADKDLTPVAVLTDVPTAVAAGVQQPYKNMKEYLAWAKQHPGKASVGLATIGTWAPGHRGAGQGLGCLDHPDALPWRVANAGGRDQRQCVDWLGRRGQHDVALQGRQAATAGCQRHAPRQGVAGSADDEGTGHQPV